MDNRKKELREEYKARTSIGGVYRLVNTSTERFLLLNTANLDSAHHLLDFAQTTDSCVKPALLGDWSTYGGGSFVIEELERLEKRPEQSAEEFRADLDLLLSIWDEKLPPGNRY